MKVKIFLMLLVALSLSTLSFAQAQITIPELMNNVVQVTLYIASGIVVILWVVTGFLFLTATGDPGKLEKAKLALFAAVGGTIIILLATGALKMVSDALNIPMDGGGAQDFINDQGMTD